MGYPNLYEPPNFQVILSLWISFWILHLSKVLMPFSLLWIGSLRWHISFHALRQSIVKRLQIWICYLIDNICQSLVCIVYSWHKDNILLSFINRRIWLAKIFTPYGILSIKMRILYSKHFQRTMRNSIQMLHLKFTKFGNVKRANVKFAEWTTHDLISTCAKVFTTKSTTTKILVDRRNHGKEN